MREKEESDLRKTKIMASGPITSWQIEGGKVETLTDLIFLGSKITVDGYCSHEIKRHLLLGKKSYDKLRQCIKRQRHHFADKGPYSQSYGFSSSHVWVWDLDHKEGLAASERYIQIVLEKTLESPFDSKELKSVNPKGNQPLYTHWKANTLAT